METLENKATNTIAPSASLSTLQPDATGIYHPQTEADIQMLIAQAVKTKIQLRVAGAEQSVAGGIYTDNYLPGQSTTSINIMMDQFRTVSFNEGLMQVTVGAGCNLGFNPFDPAKLSTRQNSLFYQLQQKGWAIPNVTNAIHQTIAGFICTGSSGGTMAHSFDEYVIGIRLIDGNGTIHDLVRNDKPDDTFFAVGSSMGLLGIIVSVTLQCIPTFNIIGSEHITKTTDCTFDFVGTGSNGQQSFENYISTTEFSRTLWWPIKSLQRIIAWQARTMQTADYNPQTGTEENFIPKPYKSIFPEVLASTMPSETVASVGFKLIAKWPQWLYDLFGDNTEDKIITGVIDKIFPYFYPLLTDLYFPCNSKDRPPQQFWDTWLGSLPMDRAEFSNNLFNLIYAELWMPIDKTQEVVNTLNQFYTDGGYAATGFYTVEFLGGKSSDFWMSPAYGQNSVRLNIMRFSDGLANDMAYYQQFWDLLFEKKIDFRVHWGKYLPPPDCSTGATYMQAQYPKWNNFMQLRGNMDPANIFLNSYWKEQLGIL